MPVLDCKGGMVALECAFAVACDVLQDGATREDSEQ